MTTFWMLVVWNIGLSTLLATAVALTSCLSAFRRRPGLRHTLWILVFVKLLTPPLIALPVLPSHYTEAVPANFRAERQSPAVVVGTESVRPHFQASAPPVGEEDSMPLVTPLVLQWLVLGIWGAGTFLLIIRHVVQLHRMSRLLRRATTGESELQELVRKAAGEMGVTALPSISLVDARMTPLLWVGWRRPLLVLPRRLVEQLNDEQLLCIVRHELAHYVRRDHWANVFSSLVTAMFWWHPVAWWARRELHIAQELCCDALASRGTTATRRCYAETLLRTLDFLQRETALQTVLGARFGSRFSIQRRFGMIANAEFATRRSWWTYVVVLTVVMLLPCLPVCGMPPPNEDPLEETDLPVNRQAGKDDLIHQDQYAEDKSPPARFEIEAEAFTSRNNRSQRGDWVKVASDSNVMQDCGEEGKPASTTPGAAQGKTFLISVGKNAIGAPNDIEYDGATVDYKLRITTPGRYRLYLRWAGRDDNTDSVYAMLLDQKGDSPEGPDYFLYHGRALLYYDNWVWDSVGLRDQTHCGFGGRAKVAEWQIDKPGIYTIRLSAREQGTAVDTLVFQTIQLPPPGDPNDSSRRRKHVFP